MRSTHRRGAGLALAAVVAAACAPEGEPMEPSRIATQTAFDLGLRLDFIQVVGACDDAEADPGEFAYRVRLVAPRQSRPYATADFPAETGALPYVEGSSNALGASLELSAILSQDRDGVALRFTAVEHDPGGPDPRMDSAEVLVPIRFLASLHPVRATVGEQPACRLVLSATPEWTVAGR